MDITAKLERLLSNRDAIRAELVELGTASETDKLAALVTAAEAANAETQTQTDLISRILVALEGKTAGGVVEPDPREPYQRVEYITTAEDDTYPYLITDIIADDNTGVEIVASFPSMADRIPMGSREDSGSTRFYCTYPLSTSGCYYGFNTGASISCATKVNTVYRLQTNFLNSRQAIIYDETGARKAFATITQTLSKHTAPIAIFGYSSAASGGVVSKREYKLYGSRVSQRFETIREYFPCYRKSDGTAGLYEAFTAQFLTAVEGTFITGPDIDW